MDRFQELRVFIAVAEAEGFAKAAAALHSSPPAVTRAVAALEDRLGVRLFDRTTRSVHLTEPGFRFLEDAKRVLGDLDMAEQDVRGRKVAGVLVAQRRSPPRHPVRGSPAATPWRPIAEELSSSSATDVDVADRQRSRRGSPPPPGHRRVHLPDLIVVLIASGDARGSSNSSRPPTAAHLRTHSVISHTTLLPGREWRYLSEQKSARMALKPSVETNDAHANIALAEKGKRITLVLSYMVADQLKASRLVPVLESHAPPAVPVHLIYAQRRIIAPKVRAFIDFAVPRLRSTLAAAAKSRPVKGR